MFWYFEFFIKYHTDLKVFSDRSITKAIEVKGVQLFKSVQAKLWIGPQAIPTIR